MRGRLVSFAFLLLFAHTAFAADSAGTFQVISDDEEYAVFAAVLFPNEPEIPDDVKNRELFLAEYRDKVRLDGVLGKGYTLNELTAKVSSRKPNAAFEGPDGAMFADYNAKNATQQRIDGNKLAGLLPKVHLSVLPETERRRTGSGWDQPRGRSVLRGGETVSLSRVGFNGDKTRALVHVDCQAGPEMGAAYLVFLEKSAKTGKWLLSGTVMTRMY